VQEIWNGRTSEKGFTGSKKGQKRKRQLPEEGTGEQKEF